MNEDEISETLDRIVPHREVPESMLADAQRRRRRTRALVGSAAVAMVVALAIPLGMTLGSTNQVATPAPTPSPSTTSDAAPSSLEPDACRDDDGNYPAVTDLPGNELPLGVSKVWLCGGPSDSLASGTYVGAPEPLTLNADWAVAVFMEEPPTVGSMLCETNERIGFTVVYEYANGDSHVVRGSLGGCDAVVSRGTYRMGAGKYLGELQDLWREQRDSEATVFDADAQVCPAKTSVMGVGIADMTRAYACAPVGDGSTGPEQIPLSEELVADMVQEITSQDVYLGFQPGVSMTAPSLVFLSAQGDPFTILGTPESYSWYDPDPVGINVWEPSPELAARIKAETSAPAVAEPSSSSEHPDYDSVCGTDDAASLAPSDLPGNTLPDGPEAVWLCNEGPSREPHEPLVGERATQQVIESFRQLSATPTQGGDVDPSPSTSQLVVVYPDGQRYVVQVDLRTSLKVMWGTDLQNVRYATPAWVAGLHKLWADQRDENPQDPPLAPRVGVCENMEPSLGRAMDRYDVDGALCTVVRGESGEVEGVEVPATTQLIADARTEAQASSVAWAATDQNPLVDWDGATVMLVDDYGDRLPILRVTADTWYWQQGEKAWEWTPSADLAARLNRAFDEGQPTPQPTTS